MDRNYFNAWVAHSIRMTLAKDKADEVIAALERELFGPKLRLMSDPPLDRVVVMGVPLGNAEHERLCYGWGFWWKENSYAVNAGHYQGWYEVTE